MDDKIKVEELKMFWGTGLMVEVEAWNNSMDGVDYVESIKLTDYTFEDLTGTFPADSYKSMLPLVRPLTYLTHEIEVDGKSFEPLDALRLQSHEDHQIRYRLNVGKEFNEWLPLRVANALASWHFDIFNWIPRGLAKEIPNG